MILIVGIYSSNDWFWWLSFTMLLWLILLVCAFWLWDSLLVSCEYCLSSLIVERGECTTWQGRLVAWLTILGLSPPCDVSSYWSTVLSLGPKRPHSLLLWGWEESSQTFLLWTAGHNLGVGILQRLLASPWVAPSSIVLRAVPLPLPLSACPDFEPVLRLFLFCEEKWHYKLQVSHFHPIWTVSGISYNICLPKGSLLVFQHCYRFVFK